jgi:hypothetical protein
MAREMVSIDAVCNDADADVDGTIISMSSNTHMFSPSLKEGDVERAPLEETVPTWVQEEEEDLDRS